MSAADAWWERIPGIDPADYAWIAEHEHELARPIPDIGVCFAFHNGERLGPFRTRREADAALDRKLAELQAQGVDILTADIAQGIAFADPAAVHAPSEETLNG